MTFFSWNNPDFRYILLMWTFRLCVSVSWVSAGGETHYNYVPWASWCFKSLVIWRFDHWLVDSPQKGWVMQRMFPSHDIIMCQLCPESFLWDNKQGKWVPAMHRKNNAMWWLNKMVLPKHHASMAHVSIMYRTPERFTYWHEFFRLHIRALPQVALAHRVENSGWVLICSRQNCIFLLSDSREVTHCITS